MEGFKSPLIHLPLGNISRKREGCQILTHINDLKIRLNLYLSFVNPFHLELVSKWMSLTLSQAIENAHNPRFIRGGDEIGGFPPKHLIRGMIT